MRNKHTFIDVSAYSSWPVTHDHKENFDESVLIPHNALYNKIHLKFLTLRSIWRVPMWSSLNRIVDKQPLRQTTETALGQQLAAPHVKTRSMNIISFRGGLRLTPNNPAWVWA